MKTRTFALWGMVAAYGCFLGGCSFGQASLIRRDMTGGMLALQGNQREAMEDAHRQMTQHCNGPYTVVAEENTAVGERTAAQGQSYASGGAAGTSSATEVREHRITYQCGVITPMNSQPNYAPSYGAAAYPPPPPPSPTAAPTLAPMPQPTAPQPSSVPPASNGGLAPVTAPVTPPPSR